MAMKPDAVRAIDVVEGDITRLDVDAIVNAANAALSGGGGVDGAIHRAAGRALLEACRPLAPCPPGEVRITPGFGLTARWVIHAVGPVWQGGGAGEPELLAACYRNALAVAGERGLASIAFPAISTGAYRFPLDRACAIALDTALASDYDGRVVFCMFDGAAARRMRQLLADRRP